MRTNYEFMVYPLANFVSQALQSIMTQAAENPNAGLRKVAYVLLSDLLDRKGDGATIVRGMPAAGLAALQKMLLTRAVEDPDEHVAQSIKHLVGNLADILVAPEDDRSPVKLELPARWSDLMPFIQSTCSSSKPVARARGFELLSMVTEYVGPTVADRLVGSFSRIIQAGIRDADIGVKVAAAVACVTVMEEASTIEAAKPLLGALPAMFGVLREAIARDEHQGTAVMEALNALASSKVELFAPPAFEPALKAALGIASEKRFEPSTRKSAIMLPINICLHADHMVRRAPAAIRVSMLRCAIQMASESEDDPEWPNEPDVESNFFLESDPSEVVTAGIDAVQQMSLTLKGRVLLPPIVELCSACLRSADWKERYAGLAALAISADGCATQLIKNPSKALAPFVKAAQSDSHPRVRFIAFQGIASLIDALSNDKVAQSVPFRQQVYKALYPFLCDAISSKANKENPRVLGAAIYALRQFVITKVKEHHVTPPSRCVVPLVEALRSSPRLDVKMFSLQVISLLVMNALPKETCESLYPRLMPVLRACLAEA